MQTESLYCLTINLAKIDPNQKWNFQRPKIGHQLKKWTSIQKMALNSKIDRQLENRPSTRKLTFKNWHPTRKMTSIRKKSCFENKFESSIFHRDVSLLVNNV